MTPEVELMGTGRRTFDSNWAVNVTEWNTDEPEGLGRARIPGEISVVWHSWRRECLASNRFESRPPELDSANVPIEGRFLCAVHTSIQFLVLTKKRSFSNRYGVVKRCSAGYAFDSPV